jgi:dUTP pyrophosphatase
MITVSTLFKRKSPDVLIPEYATDGSSGFDLHAYLPEKMRVEIPPLHTIIVPTGLFIAIPTGYELQVRPRSGVSYKTHLRISNTPGTIDSDYRGEIGILVDNRSDEAYLDIKHLERIAQAVLCPVFRCQFQEVDELPNTVRGTGGFGSTGMYQW